MDCYVVLPGRYIIENAGVNFFFVLLLLYFVHSIRSSYVAADGNMLLQSLADRPC